MAHDSTFAIDVFGTSGGVEIKINSPKLQAYLEENGCKEVFENIADSFSEAYEDWRILEAELEESLALSLCAILQKHRDDCTNGDIDSDIDVDELDDCIRFIKKNKMIIDSEAEGRISLIASIPEDGFAYVQRLEYAAGKGRLIKWPCTDGWNMNSGGGYEKIQQYNLRMYNGEIEELNDLGNTIWEIVVDENTVEEAISRTGIIREFQIKKTKKEVTPSAGTKITVVTESIRFEGSIFVLTGLGDEEEEISEIIERNGGEIKSSTVLKTNYLIYDSVSGIGTVKYKRALELIEKGKPIQMLTYEEFMNRISLQISK